MHEVCNLEARFKKRIHKNRLEACSVNKIAFYFHSFTTCLTCFITLIIMLFTLISLICI